MVVWSFALRTNAVDEAYILGTDGYIKVHEVFAVPSKASLVVNSKEVEIIEEPIVGSPLAFEAEEVMRCMRNGLKESPYMRLDESIQIMEIMDNLRKPWGLRYDNDDEK